MLHPHLVGYVRVKRVDFVCGFTAGFKLLDSEPCVIGMDKSDPVSYLAGCARDVVDLYGLPRLFSEISA